MDQNKSTAALSEQASAIKDLVKTHSDYESIRNFIDQFPILEEESINMLREAILAGYWISYYGFGWTKEQEIEFWELVYKKRPRQSGIAILTLAESYRGNHIKTLKEVIDLYFDAIDINLYHYFSLTQEGGDELDELLKNPEFNKKCLLIELNIWENLFNYSLEEIDEGTPYILKRCNGDEQLESLIKSKIEEMIDRKEAS
jgi:hypothetical protein